MLAYLTITLDPDIPTQEIFKGKIFILIQAMNLQGEVHSSKSPNFPPGKLLGITSALGRSHYKL